MFITTINLQGLHCQSCTKIVEKRLARIEGVEKVNIIKPLEKFEVTSSNEITFDLVENALDGTDYKIISVQKK